MKVKHITLCIIFQNIRTKDEKKIVVFGLAVVLALGTLGFNWVESVLPSADAHGVQAQLQSRLIRI